MGQSNFNFNDGGRKAAGFKGKAGDCVCRAIAIAAQLPYQEVYDRLAEGNADQRKSKRTPKRSRSANNGINTKRKWFKDYMRELGFVWTATMQIGSGCKVHLQSDELPSGRLVCSVSRHNVAVIDGVINDTYDSTRGGKRCVYGYWAMTDHDEIMEYPTLTHSEQDAILLDEGDQVAAMFQEIADRDFNDWFEGLDAQVLEAR